MSNLNENQPVELLKAIEHKIPELIMYAEIGRRFYEIATKHMTATCDEKKKAATAYPFWTLEHCDGEQMSGLFFSWEAAKIARQSKRRPERFAVRCYSGKYSEAYEAILDLVATIVGGDPN